MKFLSKKQENQLKDTLISSAIHEFVITRSPRDYVLHPLFNLLSLRLQKPLLFVLFNKHPIEASANFSEDCGWVHSFPRPDSFRNEINKEVAKHIRKHKKNINTTTHTSGDEWLITPTALYDATEGGDGDTAIKGLGVFYLHLDLEETETEEPFVIGKYFSESRSKVQTLIKDDFRAINRILTMIVRHRTSEASEFSHRRHVEKYIRACVENGHSIFAKPQSHYSQREPTSTNAKSVLEILKPVLDGLDEIYLSMRGGGDQFDENKEEPRPSNFDFATLTESGSPIIWGRHREAMYNHTTIEPPGIRPPNLAFYLYLRIPNHDDDYRIVPVVTPSICRDHATVYWNHLDSGTITPSQMNEFLIRLGIKNPDQSMYDSFGKLYRTFRNATDISNFVDQEYFLSFTFPAFASGLSMFLTPEPSSLCDQLFYGAKCFEEEGGDSAFVMPTLVSGFPFLSIMTKTRSAISREAEYAFDAFDYNWSFLQGVARRSLLHRIRSLVRRTFLLQLENITFDILSKVNVFISEKDVLESQRNYKLRVTKIELLDAFNPRLRTLSEVIPFARLKLTTDRSDKAVPLFERMSGLYIEKSSNEYFDHKIVNDDMVFLKDHDIKRSGQKAYDRLLKVWSEKAIIEDEKIADIFKEF